MMLDESLNSAKPFFPRDVEFWIYNTCGWGILLASILVSLKLTLGLPFWDLIFLPSFYILLLVCISETIHGLIFRRWYHQKQWQKRSILSTFPYVALIGLLGGLAAAIIVAVDGYFFREYPQEYVLANGQTIAVDYFEEIRRFGTGGIELTVIWCIAYLGIKSSRNTKDLRFKSLELENNLKEAKLNVLSGQINPHFLFNALNNIRFMIHEDANRADESLVSLSEMLRHSLESSRNEKVELAQEFAIVKQYLKLMKNQMEDRLSYSIELGPSMDKLLIPPMIVQMLVENAIKHGIEHQKQGGSVNIDCSQTPDALTIEVSNTVASSEAISGDPESKTGIGLQNINKRLLLLYGSRANLIITQQRDLMIAKLDLPRELTS